jgi:hypothetical protein
MKEKRLFKKKFPISIYETNVTVFVVDDITDMENYLKKQKLNADIANSDGCVLQIPRIQGVEYFIVFVRKQVSHNLIAHETFHLAKNLAGAINIEDEESVAWLVGHLAQKIYSILKLKKFI